MGKNFIAIILAAGLAGLTYSTIGKRLGYSSNNRTWIATAAVFIGGYIVFLITFTWVIHI